MDIIHELAEKIGAVAEAIRHNERQQTLLVNRLAADQMNLQNLMDANKQHHQDFLHLSDQFMKTYPHVVDADLTGNSLGRVFEDSADSFAESEARTFKHEDAPVEMAQAAIAEQAKPFPGSDDIRDFAVPTTSYAAQVEQAKVEAPQSWRSSHAAARDGYFAGGGNVLANNPASLGEQQKQHVEQGVVCEAPKSASSRPLVPAPDQFRRISDDAGMYQPWFVMGANILLKEREQEFNDWFTAKIAQASIDVAAEMMKPVTDGELSHLMDLFRKSDGGSYRAMRIAVDSFLRLRNKP